MELLFFVTHQDYKKKSSCNYTTSRYRFITFPPITKNSFCNLVFKQERTIICCQSPSSASTPYTLCFIHGFLYSWGFPENIRSRVIFCDGLGLCNTDQSAAIFSSVQCYADRMYWRAAGGLQSEESPLTCLRSGYSMTLSSPLPPWIWMWRTKQNKTLAWRHNTMWKP